MQLPGLFGGANGGLWEGSCQGVLPRTSAASVLVLTVRHNHSSPLQETLQHEQIRKPSLKNPNLEIASSTRGQTAETGRTTILQPVEQKPHSQKIDKKKRQSAMYQMKEQDKMPEKQLNEVEIGNLPEKEFRIMRVKMIQDLGKRMEAKIEKMQEMFN